MTYRSHNRRQEEVITVVDADVKAVDLRPKRKQAGMTQEELASRIGFARETISRGENGKDPMPQLMPARCAREFGSITGESGGLRFVVIAETGVPQDGRNKSRRESIPDDEELHDLNDVEHNLTVLNQAADVVRVMQRLVSSPLLLRSDSELSDALRIAKYKERSELDWALHGRIREGEQLHPHLVQEGLRRALAESPGAQGRESDEE